MIHLSDNRKHLALCCFSLVEVMLGIMVMGLIGGMLSYFFMNSSIAMMQANHRLELDHEVRMLSELFTRSAGLSDYVLVYLQPAIYEQITPPVDQNNINKVLYHLKDGDEYTDTEGWGDLVVFVRLGPLVKSPKKPDSLERPIQKLYCFACTLRAQDSQIFYYEIDIKPEDGFKPVKDLMPTGVLGDHAIRVATIHQTADHKRMAFNLDGKTILLNLEFYMKYRDHIDSIIFSFIATCPTS